jgi:hypothetical protein
MAGKTIMEATPVPVDLVVSCVDGMPDGATVKIETGMDECVKCLCEKIECKLRLAAGQCMLYHNGRVVNKYCYDWQVVRDWVGIANPTLLYDTDAFPKSLDLTCTMLSGKEVVVSPTPEYPGWRKLAAPITLNFELPDFTSASVKVTPGHLIGDLYDAFISEGPCLSLTCLALPCPPLPFRACPCLALFLFLSFPVLSCPFLAWPSVPFALLGGSAVAKCAPPRSWILTFPYPPCPWMLSLSVLPPFPCKSLPFLAGAAE